MKNVLYTILLVTRFSVNYKKIHKSGLKHETKYDLCKIARKIKHRKNLKFRLSGDFGYKNLKT